jgi:hypothetical protein
MTFLLNILIIGMIFALITILLIFWNNEDIK